MALAIAAGACSPGPAPLSDPREIRDRAVTHLQAASSVHVEATIDGNLALGSVLAVPGTSPGSLALTGTHLAGDLDLAHDRAAIRFEVPALLGLTGQLRQVGADAYLETTLTSPGWHRLAGESLPLGVGRPVAWVRALGAWLGRSNLVPTRLDDTNCRSGTCYALRLVAGPSDLDGLASADPGFASGIAGATVTIELRIDRASLVLSDAKLDIDLGPGGALTVAVAFSAWDAGVSIEPPPASEIVAGSLLR